MAARIEAMALPMESPEHGWSLRRIALVLLGATVAGLAFSMLYLVNRVLAPEIISAGAALATGLAGGFAARTWLGGARMGLRLTAGLAASVLGQVFLGWITWGFVGVHVQPAGSLEPDWGGLARIALGGLAVVLSLQAYGIPRLSLPEVPEVNNRSAPARRAARRGPRLRVRRRRGGLLPGIRRVARSIGRSRRPHVRLQAMVEHRCPYCLEPVLRRDPRGEVTCPECRTRHHADCWAVTGMCQVPHHHR